MIVEQSGQPSYHALLQLAALREAVAKALDRKRLLGQYAVVWKDGGVVLIRPEPAEVDHMREENSEDESHTL